MARNSSSESGKVRIVALLFFVLVMSGFLFALNYHVVTTSKGTIVIPKNSMTLSNTFVDVREWGWLDLWTNRDVAVAMVRSGHGSEIPQVERFNRAMEAGVKTLEEFQKFDERWGISKTVEETGEKVQQAFDEADKRYGIREKVEEAGEKAREKMKEASDKIKELLQK